MTKNIHVFLFITNQKFKIKKKSKQNQTDLSRWSDCGPGIYRFSLQLQQYFIWFSCSYTTFNFLIFCCIFSKNNCKLFKTDERYYRFVIRPWFWISFYSICCLPQVLDVPDVCKPVKTAALLYLFMLSYFMLCQARLMKLPRLVWCYLTREWVVYICIYITLTDISSWQESKLFLEMLILKRPFEEKNIINSSVMLSFFGSIASLVPIYGSCWETNSGNMTTIYLGALRDWKDWNIGPWTCCIINRAMIS